MLIDTRNNTFNTHLSLIDPSLWQCNLRQAIVMYLHSNNISGSTGQSSSSPLHSSQTAPYHRRSYAVTPANFHESEHYLPTCYTCHLDTSPDLNVNNKADNHSSCNTLGCNKTDSDNPLVVNLSSTHLNDHVISILSKGMKFCPTPGERDKSRAKADVDEFHLKLKYYLHFNNMSNLDDEEERRCLRTTRIGDDAFGHHEFKNPSSWVPPPIIPLENFIAQNNSD